MANPKDLNRGFTKTKLPEKQEVFIYEYFKNGFNATQAAIAAGYKEKTAYSSGNGLLKKTKVKEAIEAIKEEIRKGYEGDISLVIMGLRETIRNPKLKITDKLKASELLGRYHGMFTDNLNLNGKMEYSIEIPDDLQPGMSDGHED
ncbi:terminase small subunit [Paenibacillus sp. sgz302251]|uniref:terminase small subunit n=1 Tax=Paenibacillus sp. sgz302251 TaxID=3414493 RepID=UPI003C7CFA1F